jgi:hypothetical protein
MNKDYKQLMKIVFGTIILLTITAAYSYSYVMGNFSEYSFDNSDVESTPLNISIVNGAGFFLKSYSDTLLLLNRIEIADNNGVDYNELEGLVNSAIENMKRARESYANLKQAADRTPYNPLMITKLRSFDYNGFQQANGFNPFVFKQVEYYLGKGDVRGFYGHLLSASVDMLRRLDTIKASIASTRFPEIENLWRINQVFSQTILFGQYGSSIFKNLLDSK